MRSPLHLFAVAVVLVGAAVFCLALGVVALRGNGLLNGLGALGPALVPAGPPSAAATGRVPPQMLALYQRAAPTCPGLPWSLLAAIGTVESSNGTSDLAGVRSGANYAGAKGPMQFEPATFAAYDEPVPPGGADPPSPYDPVDAVYAAARLLCANGAAGAADISGAVFAYNHSQSYVTEVLSLARSYAK
ncbi:MAG: lytic transglycosylase domain-containing protein [Acidimicrobiales bacterium]